MVLRVTLAAIQPFLTVLPNSLTYPFELSFKPSNLVLCSGLVQTQISCCSSRYCCCFFSTQNLISLLLIWLFSGLTACRNLPVVYRWLRFWFRLSVLLTSGIPCGLVSFSGRVLTGVSVFIEARILDQYSVVDCSRIAISMGDRTFRRMKTSSNDVSIKQKVWMNFIYIFF